MSYLGEAMQPLNFDFTVWNMEVLVSIHKMVTNIKSNDVCETLGRKLKKCLTLDTMGEFISCSDYMLSNSIFMSLPKGSLLLLLAL